VDAAIAEVIPNAVDPSGAILDIGTISSTVLSATLGLAVQKSGRTTGLTKGTIAGIDCTVVVGPYSNGRSATFVNQIEITGSPTFSGNFDSGSLVVENVANNPRPVGLLIAGTSAESWANPIQAVLAAFPGAGIVGANTSQISDITAGPSAATVEQARNVKLQHDAFLLSLTGATASCVGSSAANPNDVVIQLYVQKVTDVLKNVVPADLDGIRIETIESGNIAPL